MNFSNSKNKHIAITLLKVVPALILLLSVMTLPLGCNSSPIPSKSTTETTYTYPARPTIAPTPIKIFHQDNDTYTLVTKPDATDSEIASILWQFRDAARAHTFAALHLDQKFIDARKPSVWYHVYRGPKCAAEKYTKGPLPCDASYHGAGDYTLGAYNNPQWDDAVLHHADKSETHLWDSEAPYKP